MVRLPVLVALLALAVTPVTAKTLRETTGPKEQPPASFTGNQYVDSEGCAFIRAGYGGRVTWVPRVTKDRKVVCGLPPSLGGSVASAAAAAPAPAQEAAPAAQPAVPAKPAKAKPKVSSAAVAAAGQATPKIPKGYEPAWDDDRLNPNRGPGGRQAAAIAGGTTTVGAVTNEPAVAGARYIQVGAFTVASNASGAVARISALGLPSAQRGTTIGGKSASIVLAGPFASSGEAQAALSQLRSSGFGDAFLR